MCSGLTRNLKMSEEQSEEENGLVTTEDGRFDDETAELEVIICLPRGSDPAPELVPRATSMEPGIVSADADTPDPGQHRQFGPLNSDKPMDPGTVNVDADTPDPGQLRRFVPLSGVKPWMKCRPCQLQDMAGCRRVPGYSR